MAKSALTDERKNEYVLSAVSVFVNWFLCRAFWEPSGYDRFKSIVGMHLEGFEAKMKAKPEPRTFTKFNLLPLEIRLQIWHQTLPGPRALILRSPFSKSWKDKFRRRKPIRTGWRTSTSTPIALYINQESRRYALQYYRLSLACGFDQPKIYVNFSVDWITLGKAEMRLECDELWQRTHDLEKVKNMVVSCYGCEGFFSRLTEKRVSKRFKRLINVFIMPSIHLEHSRLPASAVQDLRTWAISKIATYGLFWLELLRSEMQLEIFWMDRPAHSTASFDVRSGGKSNYRPKVDIFIDNTVFTR